MHQADFHKQLSTKQLEQIDMKVYCNGLNVYRQFPLGDLIIKCFQPQTYENVRGIEVSYTFAVLLVADTIIVQSKKAHQFEGKEVLTVQIIEDKLMLLHKNGKISKIALDLENGTKIGEEVKFAELENSDQIRLLSCGAKISIAVSMKGKLFSMLNKLDYENCDILDVKTGREHCVILNNNGDLFSFGKGSRGQLGHGTLDDECEPKLVEALAGIKIVQIACGGWHTCAISKDGDLYVWGWNGNGQLGLESTEGADSSTISVLACPRPLELDININKVACGNKHTIILLENGHLLGCGWNKYKQLKDAEDENLFKFTYLHDFSNETVLDIKCGPWNSLVLCEE